jgi:hypothetical protein
VRLTVGNFAVLKLASLSLKSRIHPQDKQHIVSSKTLKSLWGQRSVDILRLDSFVLPEIVQLLMSCALKKLAIAFRR